MFIPIVALTLVLVAVLVSVSIPKLTGQAQMRDRMARLGVTASQSRLIGMLEVAAIAGLLLGLLWMPLGAAAAIGLMLQMIGAVVLHIRAKDPGSLTAVPAAFALAAAALTVMHILNG